MTEDLLRMLVQRQENKQPTALATIISTTGSTPCKAGAKMLVFLVGKRMEPSVADALKPK